MSDQFVIYKLKVFIDANVVLEGRPVGVLPWSEIDKDGPILVMLTPRVLSEIDSKKNDKRLGLRARQFNRLIAPWLSTQTPIKVDIADGPDVFLAIATCDKIKWDAYDDLDRSESDDRVVAEVLAATGIPDQEKLFISQDINPLSKAMRHGLRIYRLDDRWLPDPLPTPESTEISRLKEQVDQYRKSEPEFFCELSIDPRNITLYKVRSLEKRESAILVSRILHHNPMQTQESIGSFAGLQDHSLKSRYRKYAEESVPDFCASFSKLLEIQFSQFPFRLVLRNVGQIRADHLAAKIRISGGVFYSKPQFVLLRGPTAPRARSPLDNFHTPSILDSIQRAAARVGRHEVSVDFENDNGCAVISAECENFAHDQEWAFDAIACLDPHYGRQHVLTIEVTAANFHGKFEKHLKPEVTMEDVGAFDLVDEQALKLTRDPMVKTLIVAALERNSFSEINMIPQYRDS
ncbi:MAG: hypothetical protein ABL985_01320 [Casimicrobium sp.]